jgi:hypothetical protein
VRLSGDFAWNHAHYAGPIGDYILAAVHNFSSDGQYAAPLEDFDARAPDSIRRAGVNIEARAQNARTASHSVRQAPDKATPVRPDLRLIVTLRPCFRIARGEARE